MFISKIIRWDGFLAKNSDEKGSVQISSSTDRRSILASDPWNKRPGILLKVTTVKP